MNIIQKGLAIAVITLFIGVAIAPSINANVSKEVLVEFTTEVCGLDGGKQTVKLTQEEAEEVEDLFDSIREKLNETETRDEAEKIFKEAIVELDKYGLLGGLSVKQAQRLVTGWYHNSRIIGILERTVDKYQGIFDNNSNYFCLVTGVVDSTLAMTLLAKLSNFILLIGITQDKVFPFIWLAIFNLFFVIRQDYFPLPFSLGNDITIGRSYAHPVEPVNTYYPSEGWIHTFGLQWHKKWDGNNMYGQLLPPYVFYTSLAYVGAIGFSGLRIRDSEDLWESRYLGHALIVKIGEKRPL